MLELIVPQPVRKKIKFSLRSVHCLHNCLHKISITISSQKIGINFDPHNKLNASLIFYVPDDIIEHLIERLQNGLNCN